MTDEDSPCAPSINNWKASGKRKTTSTLSEAPESETDADMETEEAHHNYLLTLADLGVTTTTASEAQAVTPPSAKRVHSSPPLFPPTKKQTWEERFSELKTWWYASDKGKNAKMPCDARMARWVRKQRGFRDKGTLCADRLEQMNSLEDFYWTTITTRRRCAPARKWQDSYAALVEYYNTHNQDCTIPHYDLDHTRLYQWCNVQRQARNEGNLSENQVALLDRLQFQWTHSNQDRWDACFQQLAEYGKAKGHFRVPQKSTYANAATAQLGRWANKQRTEASKGRLQADRLQKLKDIGFFMDGEALLEHNPTVGRHKNDTTGTLTTGNSVAEQQVDWKQQTGQSNDQEVLQKPPTVMSSLVRPHQVQDVDKKVAMNHDKELSTGSHPKVDRDQSSMLSSPEEELRLLQAQQLERIQERRRRQRQQHLLILGLAQPNQLADQDRSGEDDKAHVGDGQQPSHNNEAHTSSAAQTEEESWSLEDDELLQELHQAQSRVDFLKAKLSNRIQNHHVRHAAASPSPSPQHSPEEDSSTRQRQLEEQQKALLLLQQKQHERVRQKELLRRELHKQQQMQRRQEHKSMMQKANATIMLAAVATAARACSMESHRRSSM